MAAMLLYAGKQMQTQCCPYLTEENNAQMMSLKIVGMPVHESNKLGASPPSA